MTANSGQNMLDNPDMAEMINSITPEQLMAFMSMGGPQRYSRGRLLLCRARATLWSLLRTRASTGC